MLVSFGLCIRCQIGLWLLCEHVVGLCVNLVFSSCLLGNQASLWEREWHKRGCLGRIVHSGLVYSSVNEASLGLFAVRLGKRLTSVLCSLSEVCQLWGNTGARLFPLSSHAWVVEERRTAEDRSSFAKLGCQTFSMFGTIWCQYHLIDYKLLFVCTIIFKYTTTGLTTMGLMICG